MCRFLISGDDGKDSIEELEEVNNLVTPIMNYLRARKGISPEDSCESSTVRGDGIRGTSGCEHIVRGK
jgi:hypothetical protein